MKFWIQDKQWKLISLKEFVLWRRYFYKKTSKSLKAKDHLQTLERRMKLWIEGNIKDLLCEWMTVQNQLKPIGVGNELQRIAGKIVISEWRNTCCRCFSTQLWGVYRSESCCTRYERYFSEENTKAVLLIDVENAFNSINRKVILHHAKFLCSEISTYMSYCHVTQATLFIFGGDEILFKKGKTRGNPTCMKAHTLGTLPMLQSLLDFILTSELQTKNVAFSDDLTVVWNLAYVKNFWYTLATIGPRYGYFLKDTIS